MAKAEQRHFPLLVFFLGTALAACGGDGTLGDVGLPGFSTVQAEPPVQWTRRGHSGCYGSMGAWTVR